MNVSPCLNVTLLHTVCMHGPLSVMVVHSIHGNRCECGAHRRWAPDSAPKYNVRHVCDVPVRQHFILFCSAISDALLLIKRVTKLFTCCAACISKLPSTERPCSCDARASQRFRNPILDDWQIRIVNNNLRIYVQHALTLAHIHRWQFRQLASAVHASNHGLFQMHACEMFAQRTKHQLNN